MEYLYSDTEYEVQVVPFEGALTDHADITLHIIPCEKGTLIQEGDLGENLHWKTTATGERDAARKDVNGEEWADYGVELTITGNGPMINFDRKVRDDGSYEYWNTQGLYPVWFDYADFLTTLTLSEGITSIGECAFMSMRYLKEVTIPSTVKTIGANAFRDCDHGLEGLQAGQPYVQTGSLEKISLPAGIESIGRNAFSGNEFLAEVNYPKSLIELAKVCGWKNDRPPRDTLREVFGHRSLYADANYSTIPVEPMKFAAIPTDLSELGRDAYWEFTAENTGKFFVAAQADDNMHINVNHVVIEENGRRHDEPASVYSGCIPGGEDGYVAYTYAPLQAGEKYVAYFNSQRNPQKAQISFIFTMVQAEGAILTSGSCGENLKYVVSVIDPEGMKGYDPNHDENWDGYFTNPTLRLTISGKGAMTDYNVVLGPNGPDMENKDTHAAPWSALTRYAPFAELVLEPGITHIGKYAFWGLGGIEEVVIPEGVTSIGTHAFEGMGRRFQDANGNQVESGVLRYSLPASLKSIEEGGLAATRHVEQFTYPGTLQELYQTAGSAENVDPRENFLRTTFHNLMQSPWGKEHFESAQLKPGQEVVLYDQSKFIDRDNGIFVFTLKDLGLSAGEIAFDVTIEGSGGCHLAPVTMRDDGREEYGQNILSGDKLDKSGTTTLKANLQDGTRYVLFIWTHARDDQKISQVKASFNLAESGSSNLNIPSTLIRKTVCTKKQSFNLGVTAKGSISYKSDNKKVTVSKKGKVSIAKNFVGKATITVSAKASGKVPAETKTITIIVNPAGVKLSALTSSKKKELTISWKKSTKVTGYEVQVSSDKAFTNVIKTVKVTKASTSKTTVKKLKSKNTYFVRIRTYQTVSGEKYYSDWSKAKSLKVK